MEITEVKVFPVAEEKLRAFVSIVLDRCFMVNDIKVIRGRDGLFISMPSRRKKSGEFRDVAHPLNNETRQMIEARILDEYERVLAERGETDQGAEQRSVADRPSKSNKQTEQTNGRSGSRDSKVSIRSPIAPRPSAPVAKPAARSAEAAATAQELEDDEPTVDEKSLEEVAELHLRDSFWSVS